MPGFIKDKKDEEKWQKAKRVVEDQYSKAGGKSEPSFNDSDWALANHIYQNMKTKDSTRFKRVKDKIRGRG